MQKDASYHRSAVQYNEELEKFARELAKRLEHPQIKKWALSVARQHKFYRIRHKKALNYVTSQNNEQQKPELSIEEQQKQFAEEMASQNQEQLEETTHPQDVENEGSMEDQA